MNINVNWSDLNSNEKSKRIVSRRLQALLGLLDSAVLRVKVRFSDVNGPKGGVDKRCMISAKLRATGEVIIMSEGMDYMTVFSSSMARLVKAVRRELERQREITDRNNKRASISY